MTNSNNGTANAIFIDTNVLVYANIITAPLHQAAINVIQSQIQARIPLWLSRQVLREYLTNLTRPQNYSGAIPILTLTAQVRIFEQGFYVEKIIHK